MTVGKKLHQTITTLRQCKANMESFAMETDDQNAQQLYSDGAQQLDQVLNSIEGRTNYVEDEEPQFKTRQKQNQ